MTELLCPKDRSPMRTMERNGVTIERCPVCGGMFLDRGEFERLAAAEAAATTTPVQQADPPYSEGRGRHGGDFSDYGDKHGGRKHGGDRGGTRRRRKGFLSDFLDFD